VRHSPIKHIILTNADIDHIGGLLSLRDGHRFCIHASTEVLSLLNANPVFNVLSHTVVERRELAIDTKAEIADGISVECFMVPGKLPLYLEGEAPDTKMKSGNTLGLEVSAGGKRFFYIPGCAEIDSRTAARLRGASLVFFDGTLWTDDEMIASGTGLKTGRRMGHMPVSGPDGSLSAFKELGCKRLIYTHMNNTNPMLVEGSPEYATVAAAGFEVGYDGMEISL
jgi:pyrroloquinoline quinone biosynthesis protein B